MDLVDIDYIDPQIIRVPADACLLAWAKLKETERRWIMFEWIIHVVRQRRRFLILDFATAYLQSLESTLQVIGEEVLGGTRLERWLLQHPRYDLLLRGLRTLRILEAHVRAGTLTAGDERAGRSFFAHSGDSGTTVAWHFQPLSPDELSRLRSAKITPLELPDWNRVLEQRTVADLMREGLYRLQDIVPQAEELARVRAAR